MLLAASRDTTETRVCAPMGPPRDKGGHVGHLEPHPTDTLALDRVDEHLLHAAARTGPTKATSFACALGLDELGVAARVRRSPGTCWLAASDSDLFWIAHPEIAMGTHGEARQQQVDRLDHESGPYA